MSLKPHADPVPDIVLERYRLGEAGAAEKESLERRLAEDEALRARLATLEGSDAEIRQRYPDEWLAGRVRERLREARAGRRAPTRSWTLAAAAAAALVLLGVVVPRLDRAPLTPTPQAAGALDGGDRVKGLKPALAIYRKKASGSETLADGALAHAGDLVRVAYRSAGRAYGVILSIDGSGAVTLHLPQAGASAAAPLEAGESVLLDRSYELDAAPQWERFYFVTADAPFDVSTVLAAARGTAAAAHADAPASLALPSSLDTATFTLRKGEAP